jgi:hypothetical protein
MFLKMKVKVPQEHYIATPEEGKIFPFGTLYPSP